jgi:hypothetical protein
MGDLRLLVDRRQRQNIDDSGAMRTNDNFHVFQIWPALQCVLREMENIFLATRSIAPAAGNAEVSSTTAILKASHPECNEGYGSRKLKNCNPALNQHQIIIFL